MSKTASKTDQTNKTSPVEPKVQPTAGVNIKSSKVTETPSLLPTKTSSEKPPAGTPKPNVPNPHKPAQVKPPSPVSRRASLLSLPPSSSPSTHHPPHGRDRNPLSVDPPPDKGAGTAPSTAARSGEKSCPDSAPPFFGAVDTVPHSVTVSPASFPLLVIHQVSLCPTL